MNWISRLERMPADGQTVLASVPQPAGKTPAEAQALLESHPVLITEALKTCSRFTMRAIAMALEMPDPKPDPFPPAVPATKPETTST